LLLLSITPYNNSEVYHLDTKINLEDIVVKSDYLSGFPLFRDISPAVLEQIAAISEEITFLAGQSVFREGEKAEHVHFLIKGSLALKVNIMTRPDSVTVSFVEKSFECFGWSGMVPPSHFTATAYCEQDSSILAIPGKDLLKILSANRDDGYLVMQRMAEMISDRLRNSRQALLKTL
jgi:CRP-like cAMP-binding protein